MQEIPKNDSLKNLQSYIWAMNIDRGFNLEDPAKKLVLLMEELGELAKAVRKEAGMKFTSTTQQTNTSEELADVAIVLMGLSSMLGIDLFDAIVEKEKKNRERTWK
jgi:NTP pyrophosphatase (non-canonical NTP hydrolase)